MAKFELYALFQTRARKNAGRQLALIRSEVANANEAARAVDAQRAAFRARSDRRAR